MVGFELLLPPSPPDFGLSDYQAYALKKGARAQRPARCGRLAPRRGAARGGEARTWARSAGAATLDLVSSTNRYVHHSM
eukprot:scaffold71804_cov42-Phaeocystis_antarctica.AAC.2